MKHIKIEYMVARDKIKEKQTVIEHINTDAMIVDPLSDGLTPKLLFVEHMGSLDALG